VLKPLSDNVLIHESKWFQTHATVVKGREGVLVIDAGITGSELACLVHDIKQLGLPVVAGFSTHPHWDHLLWHPDLGDAPRYGTARAAAEAQDVLSKPDWRDLVAKMLPPDIAGEIPMDLLGQIKPLPAAAEEIPWDGPRVRMIEHQAHAFGHAVLLVEDERVLVAGDMLSDIFMPMLNLKADDPTGDYLSALVLLEGVAGSVDVVIPGHGSVAGAEQLPDRIKLDRAYVQALQENRDPGDPRLSPTATFGQGWLPGVHQWQLDQLAAKRQS
jgi:glyoxylase-like metal-dependent hydrolase (beta-lactamase superfamily II)